MNKNSMATIAMPTGVYLPPAGVFGVNCPIKGTISMQIAIPMAPPMNKNFLPNRSTVHVAFKVKIIPQVAFSALIKLMVSLDFQIFL